MSAADSGFARDAMSDDGGGLPHRRHLPVVQTQVPAAKVAAPYKPRVPRAPRPKREGARAKTENLARLSKRALARDAAEYPASETARYDRPVTRGDCLAGGSNAARPCPWASCAHHLALDVNARNGNIKRNFPDVEIADMAETCALDVADRDGEILETVGDAVGVVRERVRQIEREAFHKLRTSDPVLFAALLDMIGVRVPTDPAAMLSERAMCSAEPDRTLSEMTITSRRDV